MSESAAFGCLCEYLESETSLDRLTTRGTVRLALKAAGLDARDAGSDQLVVVVEKIMVAELTSRGVDDAGDICSGAVRALQSLNEDARSNSPGNVFQRMARG